MERRKFLENGALIGSGLLLGADLFAQPLRTKFAASDTVRVGVIGTGDRGGGLINLLKAFPQFQVVGCSDMIPFRLEKAMSNAAQGAKAHRNYKELLDRKDIDAVIIATPLSTHYQIAIDALAAGKHVYCEKTMTYQIKEALDLNKRVQAQDKAFMVGHQYRYMPLYFKVAEAIRAGYIGDVANVYVQWNRNGDWRRPVPDPQYEKMINWRMYNDMSGGLTAELHSHQIDFINWTLNQTPSQAVGFGGVDYWKDGRETFDNVNTILAYPNGMKVNLISLTSNAHEGYLFKFKGSKGTIELSIATGKTFYERLNKKEKGTVDGVSGATLEYAKKGEGIPIRAKGQKEGWEGTHYAMLDFYKAVTEGKEPYSNVKTGAQAAISVRMAIDALRDGRTQKWKKSYKI